MDCQNCPYVNSCLDNYCEKKISRRKEEEE